MQSNFGIVTKMGVWLMPKPEVYMPLWARVWRDDDLAPMVDTLRELMLDGTVRMVPQVMNTLLYGSIFTTREQWWTEPGAMSDAAIDPDGARDGHRPLDHALRALRRRGRSSTTTSAKIAERLGPDRRRRCPARDARSRRPTSRRWPIPSERVQGAAFPNLDINKMTAWYGGEEGGHIGFSPIAPMTGRDALAVRDLLRGIGPGGGAGLHRRPASRARPLVRATSRW